MLSWILKIKDYYTIWAIYMNENLLKLKFDNRFINELPADPESRNFPRQVYHACYSPVNPTAVSKPELVAVSTDTAKLLDLTDIDLNSSLFVDVFSGNTLLNGMEPFASCYGGHQFGQWAGQLGDGRAINLGEIINHAGEHWTLQLKGSGLTPYSRTADGLAVLRSSIREFLCSEAMYYLGIPTTRALSIITTGEQVVRDMFYDGHPKKEAGAVVCRLAQSFIRFGNFQLMADRNGIPLLKQLVDFTIKNDFPHIEQLRTASNEKEIYLQWFNEVCTRTCSMIMHWMRVGFVHGVMNTDNMSITGLTIDYGPYGWLEGFEPDWTPNTTDATHHRYAFAKQPQIAQWNLLQLANAILPLVDEVVPFEKILQNTSTLFDFKWHEMMLKKIGIVNYDQILHKNKEHEDLLQQLIQVLCCREIDMTLFFRQLAEVNLATADFSTQQDTDKAIDILSDSFYKSSPLNKKQFIIFQNWLKLYQIKIKQEPQTHQQKKQQMNQTNPLYVLRNYLAQQAIEKAEKGDYAEINTLLNLLKNPYEAQPGMERYQQKRPEWARHKAGCSMLSCSS